LYVGVTSDIVRRVHQHRTGETGGFVRDYSVHRLVYAEFHTSMTEAIRREKQIKEWRRAWKLALIEKGNPLWRDLYDNLL